MQVTSILRFLAAVVLVSAVSAGKPVATKGDKPGQQQQQAPATKAPVRKIGLGTATDTPEIYGDLVPKHFNWLVAENAMKWQLTQNSTTKKYDFTNAKKLIAYAKKNNMKMRGHTLVWHAQLPDYICRPGLDQADGFNCNQTLLTQKELIPLLKKRIKTTLKQLNDPVIKAWDVVNEAVTDAPLSEQPMSDPIKKALWGGKVPDYVERSFRWAEKYAAPGVDLFYNDYNIDGMRLKSDRTYHMIKDLKAKGVKIDGIGFQMHLLISKGEQSELGGMKENFERFAKLGLKIHITEMDVGIADPNKNNTIVGDKAELLKTQAEWYGYVADVCYQVPACEMLFAWGVIDDNSWRREGLPLLFDNDMKPKAGYKKVVDGLAGKLVGKYKPVAPLPGN